MRDTEAEKPVVRVNSNIQQALTEMAIIRLVAALMSPTVSIFADASSALGTLSSVSHLRPQVPVEAYLADYPTKAEIEARIGRPRIPVDVVVGTSIRITGVRD